MSLLLKRQHSVRNGIVLEHDQLDHHIVQWQETYQATGRQVFCRKGCANCCHLAVHATYPESVAAAGLLTAPLSERLADYVKRLLHEAPRLQLMKDYLRQHRRRLGPCPFLNRQGDCAIYDARPLSCRALLSTRPAEWCAVDLSGLDAWDRQAYESGLDLAVVAWPTHYVAATQDVAQRLEGQLLAEMRDKQGWTLAGNFAVMVWLEQNFHLQRIGMSADGVAQVLKQNRLEDSVIVTFSANAAQDEQRPE